MKIALLFLFIVAVIGICYFALLALVKMQTTSLTDEELIRYKEQQRKVRQRK